MVDIKWDEDTLIPGVDGTGRIWLYERCRSQICKGRRVVVGFNVSDDIWEHVVGDPHTVLCLTCFDEMAQDKGVKYDLTGIFPIPASWETWEEFCQKLTERKT
jgi:hypothetical protein